MAPSNTRSLPDLQEYYRSLLAAFFAGKKIILAFGPVASSTSVAKRLMEAGADGVLIIGDSLGLGTPPDEPGIEWINLDLSAASLMDSFRVYNETLQHLPKCTRERIESFDPDGQAIVVAQPVTRAQAIAGRKRMAADPAEWYALEDKSTIDALWDRLAIPRPPSILLPVDNDLAGAARALDEGAGTVWSGDATSELAGGAALVKWVRDAQAAKSAQLQLQQCCKLVRIAPYVEGIPCSIHGVVFDDTVSTFRPMEMVVFSRPDSCDFVYAGPSSYWDPPVAMREQMRAMARHVGAYLQQAVGYRGAFSIDGIASRRGFLPTELNSRCAGGLMRMTNAFENLSFFLLELLIRAGHRADYQPARLEEELTRRADNARTGGGATLGRRKVTESAKVPVILHGSEARTAESRETAMGELAVAPASGGCFVRFDPTPGRLPLGSSIAPITKSVFGLADRLWDAQIGPLVPARDVWR